MAADRSAPQTMRLFIALWPDELTRAAIAGWQQSWIWPERAALVRAERLHLTLQFLGDVSTTRLPALITGLQAGHEPIELTLGRGEVWPNGVAVLRPAQTPTALADLHARLAAALVTLELPVESRPFRAHVTLARRAWKATPPPRDADIRWRADDGYVLVRSLPGGTGYQVLARFA